jgi:hypothetical protein
MPAERASAFSVDDFYDTIIAKVMSALCGGWLFKYFMANTTQSPLRRGCHKEVVNGGLRFHDEGIQIMITFRTVIIFPLAV